VFHFRQLAAELGDTTVNIICRHILPRVWRIICFTAFGDQRRRQMGSAAVAAARAEASTGDSTFSTIASQTRKSQRRWSMDGQRQNVWSIALHTVPRSACGTVPRNGKSTEIDWHFDRN
jgi:hypothetical protein